VLKLCSVLNVSAVAHFAHDTMPKTQDPAVTITITGPDGAVVEIIEIPHPPPMPLWRRFTWRLHCWRIDLKNAVYSLKGGRW
jgi:hypothetical protein